MTCSGSRLNDVTERKRIFQKGLKWAIDITICLLVLHIVCSKYQWHLPPLYSIGQEIYSWWVFSFFVFTNLEDFKRVRRKLDFLWFFTTHDVYTFEATFNYFFQSLDPCWIKHVFVVVVVNEKNYSSRKHPLDFHVHQITWSEEVVHRTAGVSCSEEIRYYTDHPFFRWQYFHADFNRL